MTEETESQRGGVTCLRTNSTVRTRTQVSNHCTTSEGIIYLDYNVNGYPGGYTVQWP